MDCGWFDFFWTYNGVFPSLLHRLIVFTSFEIEGYFKQLTVNSLSITVLSTTLSKFAIHAGRR